MNLERAREILDEHFAERHAIKPCDADVNIWQVWWDGVKVVDGLSSKESARDVAKQMDIAFAQNLITSAEQWYTKRG